MVVSNQIVINKSERDKKYFFIKIWFFEIIDLSTSTNGELIVVFDSFKAKLMNKNIIE